MYKIIKSWKGEFNNFPAFGYETKNYIIVSTEKYIPEEFGTQAVMELRDKNLNFIKLIGSDSVTF